jgi:regulator of protease activity HflC (stomatin/prohibitin superfamily)
MTNNRNSSRTWLLVLAAGVSIFILCLGILLILTARNLSVFIEPDERGVVISMNQPTGEILEPGHHFISPGQKVIIFDIGRQTYVMSPTSAKEPDFIEGKTSDGQEIQVSVSVIYAVDPKQVLHLYNIWRDRYRDGVVRPESRNITRNTLRQYTFDEILQNQDEIEQIVFDQLKPSLAENDLILVEYNFLDIRKANP